MTDTQAAPAQPGVKAVRTQPTTRDVLAVLSTLLFVAAYFVPMLVPVAAKAATPSAQMEGAIIAQWMLVMGWYFGSSKASSQKDDTITALSKGDGQ